MTPEPQTTAPVLPLALVGEGYQIETTLSAEALKSKLLRHATPIVKVENDDEMNYAHEVLKRLAQFRIGLEKCRSEIKDPIIKIGREIDARAKEFGASTDAQERRINSLLAGYAVRKETERRRIVEDARKVAQEAERKRQEAEALQRKAEAPRTPLGAAATALKQASAATVEADLFTQKAGELIAAGPPPQKMVLDFTVTDAALLYKSRPGLCEIIPKRSEILAVIKAGRAEDAGYNIPGIVIKEVPKISTR